MDLHKHSLFLGGNVCVQFEDQDLLSSFPPSTLSPSEPGLTARARPASCRVSGGLWPRSRAPDPPWAPTEPTSEHAPSPRLWCQQGEGTGDTTMGPRRTAEQPTTDLVAVEVPKKVCHPHQLCSG